MAIDCVIWICFCPKRRLNMNMGNKLNSELKLMDLNSYKIVSEQFSMLGDANRLRIFTFLCHREECVSELAKIMSMSISATSSSLKLLKSASLISSRRDGKEVYYSVNDSSKCQLLHYAIENMMNLMCPGQFDLDSQFFHQHINPLNKEQRCHIEKIHDEIVENLDKRIRINDLAIKYSISPSALKYQFKKVYGKSIAAHIKGHRMEKAEELLRKSNLSILQIAVSVGYSSPSKFSSSFKNAYGLLPNEYRKIHQI